MALVEVGCHSTNDVAAQMALVLLRRNFTDLFEAIVGAIYMDGGPAAGMAAARTFILQQLAPEIEAAIDSRHGRNFKSLLQQFSQRHHAATPTYEVISECGPDHHKTFEVVANFGMLNNYWGLSIPLIASATATFMFRQVFLTVPDEMLEAARIDGANEIQVFFQVIIPSIRGTLITITTTVIIMVLKVFDIVFVMTSGQSDTEVIANRMFREMFTFRHDGRASVLSMILLLAVIPVMIYNIRSLREDGV